MTEKWYKEKHRELWGKIVEEYKSGEIYGLIETKEKIINGMGYNNIKNDCFACQWVSDNNSTCYNCPIFIRCGMCASDDKNAFTKLLGAIFCQDQAEAVRLAEIIRDAWE